MANDRARSRNPVWRRLEWRYAIFAAVSFWLPDVVYSGMMRQEASGRAIFVLSIVQPLCLFLAYAISRKFRAPNATSVALNMLAGLWLFSPLIISVSASFVGGGFANSPWFWSLILLIIVIVMAMVMPLFTFYIAPLNSFGLAAAVVGLIVLHRLLERGKPLLRPRGRDLEAADGL